MPRINQPLGTAIAVLATSLVGVPIAAAQSIKANSISPAPNTINLTPPSKIEWTLTNSSNIDLSSLKVFLNGREIAPNISNVSSGNLSFTASPSSGYVRDNRVRIQFKTKDGVVSRFRWPFSITIGGTSPPPTTAVPLQPQLTNYYFNQPTRDRLIFEGTTQPGAQVTANINATRPVNANLGIISVPLGGLLRQFSRTVTADSAGKFTINFNVAGDPVGTQYDADFTSANAVGQSAKTKVAATK